MEITFKFQKLRKLAGDYSCCKAELGHIRAKLFHKRLEDLRHADTLEDLRYFPGHYHELKGNRKGQWACHLDQPYRLIFKPHENPLPVDNDGKYLWIKIRGVEILEILNYHI